MSRPNGFGDIVGTVLATVLQLVVLQFDGVLKCALDEKRLLKGTKDLNRTIHRMRLIVPIAVTTGMRSSEIWGLLWPDILYGEGLIAVRAKLKGGKMRYVPMPSELASELQAFQAVAKEDGRVFPLKGGTVGDRRLLEGSFDDLLKRAEIRYFRFHDLRHTFPSWYMMNGGDLYELAKILGHSNTKMTERCAKLGKTHMAKTSNMARGNGSCWNREAKRRRLASRVEFC
jgi:integrase